MLRFSFSSVFPLPLVQILQSFHDSYTNRKRILVLIQDENIFEALLFPWNIFIEQKIIGWEETKNQTEQ